MEYTAIHGLNASFYFCIRYLYLGLTLILLITHHSIPIASAQPPTPCAPQEECSICQMLGDLRLVGGENFTEGRVEFCYNNTWGTVCDNGFGVEDATVVCRQLGFSDEGALSVPFAIFGAGTGPIVLDFVNCEGNEARLIDCSHDGLGEHSCNHLEDVGVRCMIRSIGTISASATTQIQSITQTQIATLINTDSSIRRPSTSSRIAFEFSTSEITVSDLSTPISIVTASPTSTSGIIPVTMLSASPVLTSQPITSASGGRQSSVSSTPPDTGENRSLGSSNTGLIVGLVFLFLILIVVASIVIVLLVIILLRKRKEKQVKSNTRFWYIQENPMAQSTSFEGDSIFNLLEETNESLRPPGQRDSTPDFLVVRHGPLVSTVPNAYNTTPGLETKTVPMKTVGSEHKVQLPNKIHDESITEMDKSPPNSLPSTIVINANERVIYTDVTFKSGSPIDTKKPLYDVQEEEGDDYDSEWSQQSSFESEEEDKEAEGTSSKDLTYSEVQFT